MITVEKKLAALILVTILLTASSLQSAVMTIEFRPNDWFDSIASIEDSSGDKATQENARAILKHGNPGKVGYITWTTSNWEIYTAAGYNVEQNQAIHSFYNWADGLGDGEGIAPSMRLSSRAVQRTRTLCLGDRM